MRGMIQKLSKRPMKAVVKQEALLSVPPPRWLDEKTEIPKKDYGSYHGVCGFTWDPLEYRIFLPHRAPNCGMTTTFSDLCDFLCEPLKHAHDVKRRKLELWAEKKEHDALLEEMDITLLKLWNCVAMHTAYPLLSKAWKRRLHKLAERRSIILSKHCTGS